jgi:hypothetical protein
MGFCTRGQCIPESALIPARILIQKTRLRTAEKAGLVYASRLFHSASRLA